MKAAIYARKSTDDDRFEENKSVTRQVDNARAYAERKGWTVDEDHVYVDDGISGAEFKNRPALLRMLNALGEFDVIATSELSRLGREQSQTANVLANVYAKNRKIFFYLTDEEVKFESAVDKFMVSAVTFGAELEREKASQRSRDALARKAARGYNAGGVVYGYDNVPVEHTNANGEKVKLHTEYQINEDEAGVIRAIFRMYVDGHGHATIAKILNGDPGRADKVREYLSGSLPASPRKGTGSWAPSSVRGILVNPRYTGKIPFGKHRKTYRGGTKARIKQDEYELIDAPHLRIVPPELWDAAAARRAAAAKTYLRDTNGTLWGRPGMGRESKYLLTGRGRCAVCGANIQIIGGVSGVPGRRKRIYCYGCSYHHNRGPTVCSNDHKERLEILDEAVLEAIETQILTPEAVAYTLEKAFEIARARRDEEPDRVRHLEAELKKVNRELDALVVKGKAPNRVVAEIEAREARIKVLEVEIAGAAARPPTIDDLDTPRLKRALRDHLSRFRDLIREDVPLARQALRKLLGGEPMRVSPVTRDGKKALAFEGSVPVGALVGESYLRLASPTGFEPVSPP